MLSLQLIKQSSIARRLLLWFLVLALVPMIILAFLVYHSTKHGLRKPEEQKLWAVADFSINRMERWARERKRSVTNLAHMTDATDAVRSFTAAFESAPKSEGYANSVRYKDALAANEKFITYLKFLARQYKYPNIYFISGKGDIVAALNYHPVLGANLLNGEYDKTEMARVFKQVRETRWADAVPKEGWIEGETSDFRPFAPAEKGRAAFIVAPIRDCPSYEQCREANGALAVEMREDAIQTALDNRGMTDEQLGFNSYGRTNEVLVGTIEGDRIDLLNKSPLDADRNTFTIPSEESKLREAIANRTPWTGDMVDYRGEETITRWMFLKSPALAVVVKVDKKEANALANAHYYQILWLGGLMAVPFFVLALLLARSIYGPIGRLTRAVRSLPSSDFRRRLGPLVADKGEIGELSRALGNANDELWLLQSISNTANEATSVESALRTALEQVCSHTGMLVGHVYEPNRDGVLVSTPIWHPPDAESFQNFRRASENLRLHSGTGLPGRVLQSGLPEWAEDVKKKDGNCLPALAADEIEVRGGFAFPILVGKEVTAVLEFFTNRPAAPNPSLLRTMKTVGTLLGRAIERKREDELLKEKAANQAKSDFLDSVSHDLRTPLGAILGYSEMYFEKVKKAKQRAASGGESLDDGEARGLWEEEKQEIVSDLGKIFIAGQELREIIDNVLDFSNIGAGKMTAQRVTLDVASLVREVVQANKRLVENKDNSFEVHCPDDVGTMYADRVMVKRILTNLLANAGKFTRGGVVSLSVERRAGGASESIIFRVRDTGIGMTEEQQGRIFESFTQAEKSTKSYYGGTGLGLTICKNFCQAMGGDITVESERGRGTVFTVQLPAGVFAPREEDVVNTAELQAPPDGATIVLVIDDDPTMRELSKRYLTKEGFHVEAAASGEDGLRLARKLHPDVITLDVIMPGMDGYSVVAALEADEELRDIPVVMLTIVDEKDRRLPRGVAEYMTKPINWEQLAALLNKYRREPEVSCTILVVEDDDGEREIIRRTLEKDKWDVETAENGRVGLERVASRQPDLILLDLKMPEMDGYEFLKALRREPRWATIPVAIITYSTLDFEDRLRLSGRVEKFLEKGTYSQEELLREVRDMVAACVRRRPAEAATVRM